MKLYMEPIEVKMAGEQPASLRWRRGVYRVQAVMERWTWRGRWWTDPEKLEGERRVYYRLVCDRAMLEIFRRSGAPQDGQAAPPWVLSRAVD